MSKYGGSVSFAQACNYDKEEIKAAFEGMIRTGETERGFTYEKADIPNTELEKLVLSAYDGVVYQALEAMKTARVLERLYRDKVGEEPDFASYLNAAWLEDNMDKHEYKYESEE